MKHVAERPAICFDCGHPYVPGGGHFAGPVWVCRVCLGPVHEDRAALVARGFEPCACSPLARPITPPPGRDRLSRGDWTVLAILWLLGLLAVGLLIFRSR